MRVVFTLDGVEVIQFLLAIILPLLVGLVTTKVTKSGTRAVLLAFLSLVTALLTELLGAATAGVAYDVGAGLLAGVGTFVIAVAMHYGLWKPTQLADKAQSTLITAKAEPVPF